MASIGVEHEVLVDLRTRSGEHWGARDRGARGGSDPGVVHPRCPSMADGSGHPEARGATPCRTLRCPNGAKPACWARGVRQCTGALGASRMGDAARPGAGGHRRPACGGHDAAGRSGPAHPAADGRIRDDRAGGAGHPARAARGFNRPDRRNAVHLPPTRCSSTSSTSSRRPPSAAAAIS